MLSPFLSQRRFRMNILYSINCPNCLKLERELCRRGIEYEVEDDINKMRKMGFSEYPIFEVDGMLMNYETTLDWLEEIE